MAQLSRRGLAWLLPAGLLAPAAHAQPAGKAQASPIRLSEVIDDAPPYAGCHASTLAQTRSGALAAAWFGGPYERHPDVTIYFARQQDGRWLKPVPVADGVQPAGAKRLPTWNPVLFQAPDAGGRPGELFLFYKVGPSPSAWWGMVITSADEGRSWSQPRRLPDGILGPVKNKPVVLADGAWLSASSVEGLDKAKTGGVSWQTHFERSTDRGATWTRTAPVQTKIGIEAIQGSILTHKDGALQAIARTKQGALAQTWSRDGGATWSNLGAIDLPNPNSGTDALTLADGRHLVVYNHSGHRAKEPGKGDRWPLNIALSDDGVSWRPVLTLESKPMTNGYAYPAVIQTRDGLVHVTYTWGRTRIRHVVLDPKRLA